MEEAQSRVPVGQRHRDREDRTRPCTVPWSTWPSIGQFIELIGRATDRAYIDNRAERGIEDAAANCDRLSRLQQRLHTISLRRRQSNGRAIIQQCAVHFSALAMEHQERPDRSLWFRRRSGWDPEGRYRRSSFRLCRW